jgi:hypothetical protein
MEPPKQNITQTAIHVPQGEGKSLWILDELLTFKVHDQSETVGSSRTRSCPKPGRLRTCTAARMKPTTSSKVTSSSSLASARSIVVWALLSTFPGRRCTPSLTQEHRRARSCLSRRLQDRWSSFSKRPVSRLATPLRPHKVRRTWINCRPVPSEPGA